MLISTFFPVRDGDVETLLAVVDAETVRHADYELLSDA